MGDQGHRGVVGLGLHVGVASSRRTCCARWAAATSSRTARSASPSAASRPRKRSTTRSTCCKRTVAKLRELSPLWEMYKEGIDISTDPVGGALSRLESGVTTMAYSDKGPRPLRESAQRRLVRQGRRRRRHRHGRRAGLRRRDEAADQGRPDGVHRGREVQDLRLRLGDRVVARWSPNGSRARRSTRR